VLALLLLGLFSVPLVVLNAAAATKAKAIPADITQMFLWSDFNRICRPLS
jgi:hypothetical protein